MEFISASMYVVAAATGFAVCGLCFCLAPAFFRDVATVVNRWNSPSLGAVLGFLGTMMTSSIALAIVAGIVFFVLPSTHSLVVSAVCPSPPSWGLWLTHAGPCSYRDVSPPSVTPFVNRAGLVAEIMDPIKDGTRFVVLDGANGMGKTMVSRAAAAQLSKTHAVFFAECTISDKANSVLSKLLLLQSTVVEQILSAMPSALRPLFPTRSFDAISDALRAQPEYHGHEPVFVVEMAERLSLADLKTLLDLAKLLADERRGRFLFVFSPSAKLNDISGFGSMTRAKIVPVGDLTDDEALSFLRQLSCDTSYAKAIHQLVDGHLRFLLDDHVRLTCLRKLTLCDLQAHFSKIVCSVFEHVDQGLTCGGGCACKAACAVHDKDWGHAGLERAVPLLLKEHIVRASLADKIYKIDSRFVLGYIARECACNHTFLDLFVLLPCAG